MEQEKLRELFDAIKKDDAKSFSFLMTSNTDLNISFGRFPILSLLYLYGSYNILKVFEKHLMPIHNFKREEEPYEAYKKFKSKAKKAVRLYQDEECFVYPAEMLAIVDNRFLLDKNYKNLYKNDEIALKIEKIYNLSGEFEISLNLQKITLKKKKLTFKQKMIGFGLVAVAILFSLLAGLSVVFVPAIAGRGTAKSPIKIANEVELVTALGKGNKYYELENDIILTKQIDSKDFSGTLDGNGFKVVAGANLSDGLVENLSGTITNLGIDIDSQNFKIDKNYGVIAKNSTGKIENCVISGSLSGMASLDEDVNIGLFVATNSGSVKNCTSRVKVSLSNSGATNVYYSNFVCVNDGSVEGCSASVGEVVTDTVDIAGIVCTNNGAILNCENYSSLSQTSAKEWHPNVGGIVCANNGTISSSQNHGELFAESTLAVAPEGSSMYVFIGGISCNNYNEIINCKNTGSIVGKGNVSAVYAAGITATNESSDGKQAVIKNSKTEMSLSAESVQASVYAAGVAGYSYSVSVIGETYFSPTTYYIANIEDCGFVGSLNTNAKNAYVAGVVARNSYGQVLNNYSSATFHSSYEDTDGDSLLVNGGIVSITENSVSLLGERLINGNHYVKASEALVAVNIHYVSYYTITPLSDTDTNSTAYNSLDEIPEEVRS